MRTILRPLGFLAAVSTLALSLIVTSVSPVAAEQRFGWCDGTNPNSWNARFFTTPRSTTLYGRTIELRYSTEHRCAWGRIRNGSPGDDIWVDRSFDGGRTWQPQLGHREINTGTTQYTVAFDDKQVLMRACGRVGLITKCTGWY